MFGKGDVYLIGNFINQRNSFIPMFSCGGRLNKPFSYLASHLFIRFCFVADAQLLMNIVDLFGGA